MSSNIINISGNASLLDLYHALPLYAPISAGSYEALAELTLKSANQCFPFLQHLIEKLGASRLTILDVQHFSNQPSVIAGYDDVGATQELKRLFDHYGSDKANAHNYHLLYGPILQNKAGISGVFEMGLGTNNTDTVSNMGTYGRPGASLRAFRDFLPNAQIYGADVDHRILFEEERIKTYFSDQTNLDTLSALSTAIPDNLNLIIDDGLHSPNANIAMVAFGVNKLQEGGWLIIEDIQVSALPVWHVVAALLPPTYECYLLKTALSSVFAVKKLRA